MDRAEKVGLGVAGAGHLVLFGLLSVGFLATPNPEKLRATPVEVSLVEDVALESASPEPAAEPAPSIAPDQGPPEDAAPPEPAPPAPEPAPPEPRPAPPPPAPAPRPQPAPPRPAPAPKAQPAPPKPAPAPKAAPKAAPKPPQPAAAQPKAAPKQAQPKAAPARPAAAPKQTAAPAAAKKGAGATQTAAAARPRGSRLGDDFLKGLSAEPSRATSPNPPAARVGAQAAANIASAITRQVQPCANRNVSPGPGAERIRVAINLRLNRDGSLAAKPTVRGVTGVDDDNRRYADRVGDLAVAAFVGCSPLRGLPPELYDVPGGWSNFTLRYKIPG